MHGRNTSTKGVVMGHVLHVHIRRFVALLSCSGVLIFLFAARPIVAQTEKASISGRITDQSNAVMPDAELELKNTDTGIVTLAKTNDQGVYVFPSLSPGNYVITCASRVS